MSSIGPTIIDNEDAIRLHRIYEAVSNNIERENALISFRITWAILLSAGILATETFIAAYSKDHYPNDVSIQSWAQAGIIALSVLASFFCFMSKQGVQAAQAQMIFVQTYYTNHESNFRLLGYPRPYGNTADHEVGYYNALAFPLTLLFLWLAFVGMQTYRLVELRANPEKILSRAANEQTKALNALSSSIASFGPKLDALLKIKE